MFGASSGGYSLQMASSAESALADRSPINICPIACNLGEILMPVNQGGPENGGAGENFLNRYSGEGTSSEVAIASKGINWPLVIAIPGALVALFFLIR